MDFQNSIIDHYISNWGGTPLLYLWDKGPIDKLPIDFRVLEFEPTPFRNMWTYATCCMSEPVEINPIELHIFSGKKDESIIELLTSVAFYHHNTAKLNLHDTINFGRPWTQNSLCKFGYVSLPYLDGPKLENLKIEKTHKFFWLIPITEKEKQYKRTFGYEKLEESFEKGLNYLDPNRQSSVE